MWFESPALASPASPATAALVAAALSTALLIAPAQASESSRITDDGAARAAQRTQLHVMAGTMAAGREMPELAAQEFLRALDDTADAELAARATALALTARRDDLAQQAALKWLQADPSAMEAREVLMRIALKSGKTAEAREQAVEIIDGHPGGEAEGLRNLALLLSQQRDGGETSLNLLRGLVAERPNSAAAQRALALLAFRFDDAISAEKAAREALRLAPQEREASLLLVGALIKKGDIAGAGSVFETLVGTQKDVADLRMGYVKLLLDANQIAPAHEQLQKVLTLNASHPDALYALGLMAMDARKPDEAEARFTAVLDSAHRYEAHYYLGRIAEWRQQPQAALAQYEQVRAGNQLLDAVLRRAGLLADLNRMGEARDLFAGLRNQFSNMAPRLYVAEADLLAEHDNFIDALAVYDLAIKLTPDNADLGYGRALLYERMSRIDQAEAELRRLIARDGDDARALNALGYMLTVHGGKLDEAARLIGRAAALSPNDPAVLDSQGWVLFKQGKTREALPPLTKAHALFPDAEVAAHLGEALWALGERDRARSIWEAALRASPQHPVLRETLQRLTGNIPPLLP